MLYHARFNEEIADQAIQMIKKSNKYVIARETANRVHYHAAFEIDLGIEAIKKRFQKFCTTLNLVTARGKGNAYYGGIKECTDVSYVCKEGDIVATTYPQEEITQYIQEGKKKYLEKPIPIVSAPLDSSIKTAPIVVKKARLTMTERVIAYCENELKWKKDQQWSLESYEYAKAEVLKHMTQFLRAKFNDPQGIIIARNCLYEFADPGLKEQLERIVTQNIKNYL